MEDCYKEKLINKLIYGIIIISIVYCISVTLMVSSMWHSYFATEYGYAEQDISNVNTTNINE